ncbi:MAG: hypothetical protein QXK24_02105 [Ignisphaera sp.]
MATRIKLVTGTGIGTSETQLGSNIQPPSGVKWTLVEIRPYASAAGKIRIYFDTELYYELYSKVTPMAVPKPHAVALDVMSPHFISVKALADSGTADFAVELVIEESPAT